MKVHATCHRYWVLGVAVCFLLVTAACSRGPSRPKTYPVSGVVTLNGQPVAGATVVFVPKASGRGENAPRAASGKTDEQGRYSLTTFGGNDGAVPGEYFVKVSKIVTPSAAQAAGASSPEEAERLEVEAAMRGQQPEAKNELPEKYNDPKTSGLSFTVEAKENTFNIELTP